MQRIAQRPAPRTYWPQTSPKFSDVTIRRATRAELVRVKSEYEWRIGREFATVAPSNVAVLLLRAGQQGAAGEIVERALQLAPGESAPLLRIQEASRAAR